MVNILLIHGLGRTPLSMWPMGRALQKAGHSASYFGYASWQKSFDEIAEELCDRLKQLSSQGHYGIVSHSLGGVLTRAALADADFPPPGHVVMLAPPNQSPLAARLANRLLPFRWFARQSGDNMARPEFYAQLPTLTCPYTLIAGDSGPIGLLSPFGQIPNDLIVSIDEVRMQPDDELIRVPALHTFIMNHPLVQQATIRTFADPALGQ